MPLELLSQGVTLECSFGRAVDAYFNTMSVELGQGHAASVPTDIYSLKSYGDVPVIATGILMASHRTRELRKRYPDGCTLTEKDIQRMNDDDVYYKPMMIKSGDGRINWQKPENLL